MLFGFCADFGIIKFGVVKFKATLNSDLPNVNGTFTLRQALCQAHEENTEARSHP